MLINTLQDRMLGEHEMTIRDIEDRKPNIEAILQKGGLIVEAIKHPGMWTFSSLLWRTRWLTSV